MTTQKSPLDSSNPGPDKPRTPQQEIQKILDDTPLERQAEVLAKWMSSGGMFSEDRPFRYRDAEYAVTKKP